MRRHRWLWIISIAVLAVAGAAGLAGWYVWLPGYRPALGPAEIYGIDVSGHQGQIDWRAVARSGVSFVFIKATEGSTYVDPDFARDLAQARSAGLLAGAYHFFTLCSPGASQAANFLTIAPPGSTVLQRAVDLELSGDCSARPSLSEVRSQLSDFVNVVEKATAQPVMFYIGASFEQRYPLQFVESGLLWKRSILLRPPAPWAVWQVDGFAHIAGITGPVDLDVMKTDHVRGPPVRQPPVGEAGKAGPAIPGSPPRMVPSPRNSTRTGCATTRGSVCGISKKSASLNPNALATNAEGTAFTRWLQTWMLEL